MTYPDISESFRVLDGRPTSYFRIEGMPNYGSTDAVYELLKKLEDSFPTESCHLKFVFVRDPLRLRLGHEWKEDGKLHSLCQRFRENLSSEYVRTHAQIVHEVCYLEVSTEPPEAECENPIDRHLDSLAWLSILYDRSMISRCSVTEYDEELARPATIVDIHDNCNVPRSPFNKLTRSIGLGTPWRMVLTVDTDKRLAKRLVRKAACKSRLLSVLVGKKRAPNPYEALLSNSDSEQRWVTAKLHFESWGCRKDDELRNLFDLSAAVSAAGMLGLAKGEVVGLSEAISMMPITRPGSPWKSGEVLFTTPDAKLFPYGPRSNEQVRCTEAVFFNRESDIEHYHRSINSGLVARQTTPPQIARIKIGTSADSFLCTVSSELSELDQGLVVEYRAAPDAAFSINILDTALGMRKPENSGTEAIHLLGVLLNKESSDFEDVRISMILGMAIQEAFYFFSDDEFPKRYREDALPAVTAALVECGIPTPVTWWEAVDLLHSHKRHDEAILAQRQAVPVLSDLIWFIRSNDRIQHTFGLARACYSDESLTEYLARSLENVIKAWPSLSTPTTFTLGQARLSTISVIDDRYVQGLRKDQLTCALYLLARKALCSGYFNDPDRFMHFEVDERYVAYHRGKYQAELSSTRKICYSNADVVTTNDHVMRQLLADIRESRKLNVMVAVDSKSFSIPREILECSSTLAALRPEEFSSDEWSKFGRHNMAMTQDRPGWAPGGLHVLLKAQLNTHRFSVQQHLLMLNP